jgi:hypothetical protein
MEDPFYLTVDAPLVAFAAMLGVTAGLKESGEWRRVQDGLQGGVEEAGVA